MKRIVRKDWNSQKQREQIKMLFSGVLQWLLVQAGFSLTSMMLLKRLVPFGIDIMKNLKSWGLFKMTEKEMFLNIIKRIFDNHHIDEEEAKEFFHSETENTITLVNSSLEEMNFEFDEDGKLNWFY